MMNLEGFEEVKMNKRVGTSRRGINIIRKVRPIFVSIDNRGISFSRATVDDLKAEYVKLLVNSNGKQFALVPADEGYSFMKSNKKTQVVRWNNSAVDTIRDLLPEGRKSNIRINGKIEDGVAIFDCNDLSERRKGATA